ncbi:balbiani ring protein 3-like [Penaeus monodon]|uniref:balbiani ring protein 3-like n=1 Tax=Penaeus monodon TaxID=6687 RepID=UPI0018A77748|nr:balbiani ring protein 3-like [Penaeus monodon]
MMARTLLPLLVLLAKDSLVVDARGCLTIREKRNIQNMYLDYKCMRPGEKFVDLTLDEDYVSFVPTMAKVRRCSMMYCMANDMRCQATGKANETIKVEAYSMTQGIQCLKLIVEHDVGCKCQRCLPRTCPNNNMDFNRSTCKCECTQQFIDRCRINVNKGTHMLDRENCRCMCNEPKRDCGRRMWNPNTCRCMD